ncbi:substrate-binding domain-containing protein [Bacillus sp. N9]
MLATKINEEITKNGYSMILSINPIQTSLDIFKRYQAEGIIIFNEDNEKLDNLTISMPIISYGVGEGKNLPIIDVNYQKAMYTAVEHLVQYGHSHIAFVGDFSSIDDRQVEKYKGFQKAMEHFQRSFNHDLLINTGGLSWYDGYITAKRLLKAERLPTAVIGASYDISAGIVRAIREANLLIPKDISVISYDNIPKWKISKFL